MPDAHESCTNAPSQPHNCSRFIVYTNLFPKVQALIDFSAGLFTGRVLPRLDTASAHLPLHTLRFFEVGQKLSIGFGKESGAKSRSQSASMSSGVLRTQVVDESQLTNEAFDIHLRSLIRHHSGFKLVNSRSNTREFFSRRSNSLSSESGTSYHLGVAWAHDPFLLSRNPQTISA